MNNAKSQSKDISSLKEFYPLFLEQHKNATNQKLHVIGTILGILFVLKGIFTYNPVALLIGFSVGYGLPSIGHLIFEKNKPKPFNYPVYSILCDFIMVYNLLLVYIGKKEKL